MNSFAPSRASRSAFVGGGDRAFTLIELLTVIAIIGILAAILIPVVGTVRGKARSSQCASNLRQIGMAMNMYADENKGNFPTAGADDPAAVPWITKLAPYVGVPNGMIGAHPALRAAGIFNCPDFITSGTVGDLNFRKVAYAYQDNISPRVYSRWNYRRSAVPVPSQYFLLAEVEDNIDTFKPGTYKLPFRHSNKSANFLFVDGHVASLQEPVTGTDPRWRW